MKKFTVTLTDDLFAHLEALKLYYGYSTRSEIVEKALDELIKKHSSNDVFRCYLSEARNRLKAKEVEG
jgi:ribbon-helix-helix protein, copG family